MNQLRIVTSPNETVICCICLVMVGMEVSSLQPPGVSGENNPYYHVTKDKDEHVHIS